jgi:catechol 2,3-dioxygenase-like lactoylglutathione lyase family enzyme
MATPSTPAGDAGATITTKLDHIAIAVDQWTDAWPRYVDQLGGVWHSGGVNVGFSPAQLAFGNGAKVEVLQPWDPDTNPFLRRFLDHNGPGPHHITFKVADIEDGIDRVRAAGFEPVNVRLSDPQWREAFLHPRQATGVVVQMAQEQFEWISPEPEGFPQGLPGPRASLVHVTHAVADLDAAVRLFHDLLDGAITARGSGPDGGWEYVDLNWGGPLALRLVAPTESTGANDALRTWLGDRPGRVHHLAFTWPGAQWPPEDRGRAISTGTAAGAIPGLLPGPGSVITVPGTDNLGAGLVVRCLGETS